MRIPWNKGKKLSKEILIRFRKRHKNQYMRKKKISKEDKVFLRKERKERIRQEKRYAGRFVP